MLLPQCQNVSSNLFSFFFFLRGFGDVLKKQYICLCGSLVDLLEKVEKEQCTIWHLLPQSHTVMMEVFIRVFYCYFGVKMIECINWDDKGDFWLDHFNKSQCLWFGEVFVFRSKLFHQHLSLRLMVAGLLTYVRTNILEAN